MLVHHAGGRHYLLTALETSPDVLTQLLKELSTEEIDFRPDPERFTIREVVAHLADWDNIFLTRMEGILHQDNPTIEEIDEGQRALDFDYAQADVATQLDVFRKSRNRMLDFLCSLSPEEWQRSCMHPSMGSLTIEALATLVPLHDAYHFQQVIEWRRAFAQKRAT